jgi:hypothetical protein
VNTETPDFDNVVMKYSPSFFQRQGGISIDSLHLTGLPWSGHAKLYIRPDDAFKR